MKYWRHAVAWKDGKRIYHIWFKNFNFTVWDLGYSCSINVPLSGYAWSKNIFYSRGAYLIPAVEFFSFEYSHSLHLYRLLSYLVGDSSKRFGRIDECSPCGGTASQWKQFEGS